MANPPLVQEIINLREITENALRESRNQFPPPLYDESKESFRSFVRRMNDYLNAKGATFDDACRMLPMCLRGSARDAYDQLPLNIRQGPWDQLLVELQQLICTEEKGLLAQAELSSEKQGSRSVDVYARLCRELATKAYPTQQDVRDAVLLTTFVNGLRPELRTHVRRLKPLNFAAAREAAVHEKALTHLDASDGDVLRDAISSLTEEVHHLAFSREENLREHRSRTPNRRHYEDRTPSPEYRPRNSSGEFYGERSHRQWSDKSRSRFRDNYDNDAYSSQNNDSRGSGQSSGRGNRRRQQPFRGNNRRQPFNGYRDNSGERPMTSYAINSVFDPTVAPTVSSKGRGMPINAVLITICLLLGISINPVACGSPTVSDSAVNHCLHSRSAILVDSPKSEKCEPRVKNILLDKLSESLRSTDDFIFNGIFGRVWIILGILVAVGIMAVATCLAVKFFIVKKIGQLAATSAVNAIGGLDPLRNSTEPSAAQEETKRKNGNGGKTVWFPFLPDMAPRQRHQTPSHLSETSRN